MPEVEPSEMEMQVLSLLWTHGPSTARQVLERMPDGKRRAYTSVLSTMQVMEKKKLLAHRTEGTTHVYRARVARASVLGKMLGKLVKHVFSGDTSLAVQSLLEHKMLSQHELRQIRRLIDAHAKNEPTED
jgi:BlaI family transcriptional regulator, penicillinase repressor